MKVTLDHDVFKWIVGLGVIGLHQVKHTGKVELDENMSKLFLNGIKFAEVLNKMFEAYNINMPNISDSMKNQVTAGVRLFNWNLLQETFQKINLPLDNDIKQLIVQGDIEMLNELLKDMLDFHEKHKPKPKTQQSIRTSEESFESSLKKPPSRLASKLPQTKFEQQQQQQGELDLDNVDTRKQLNDTQSLLDFLITGLSRHLQLKPQQAAALLSNGNKYLAHLLVKGVKGEFDTLINWLSEVYANLSRIYHFFEQQDANVGLFLTTIKPGLLSKEQEITLWTLRIIGRIIFELSEMEMHQLGYEWFCNSGLAATFMCLQRHPQLVSQICELYSQVARYNMIDFFTVQFRKQLADKCVDMFNQLLDSLHAQKNLKDELINQGIIQYWAKEAMKQSDSDVLETKMTGLQYLSQNWMYFPIQFEEDQNYPTQFLFLMKKCTRDASNVLKFFSLNNLFRLLDKLATERNPYAAVLYKKLTFTLIENYTEIDVREFMLYNFMYLIQRYSSIPIDILIEPFVKQVLINDSQINLPDMVMFKFLANHPKMKLRLAIILLDLLSKIYLNNITMSHLAFGPIQLLMARYGESQLLQEYAFKLAKISLALHFGSLKSKKTQTKVNDLSILSVLQQHSNDHEILEAQKRAQIIELCKYIINLQQDELNEQIKPLLCHFYLELQNIHIKDKGIITLLNMFGNPESIVAMMKEQWDKEKEEQEEILRQSLIEENQMENEFTTQAIVDTPMTNKTKQSNPDPFNELRQKEQDDEKQFLQQHGVGFKKRIVDIERGKPNQNTKKGQVDPKVLENIANIKLKKEEEQLRKQLEEEEKKRKFDILQKKAQQEIQKRTKQPEKQDEKKVELIDLDEHERMDVESMNMALKRHQKSVKYLFSKYSNSTNHASKKQYFNELQEQFEIIQFSDVLRLCRDFNINLPKDELQGMVKSINHKYGDNKIDQLDYTNFERFIVQIALKTEQQAFIRGPAGNCFDNMIFNFGQQAKIRNENSIIFLDPDNLQLDPDRDQIKQLNLYLQQYPAQLLQTQEGHLQKCDELLQNNNFWKNCRSQPNKFKIITEKQFVQFYNYKPQTIIGLSQSWLHCNEIVNELIMESFVSPIMEPQSDLKLVTKVKTKLQNEPISKIRDLSQKRVTNKAIEDKMQKKQEEEQLKQEAEEKRKRHQEKLKQEYLRKKKEKEEEEQQKKQEERQQQIDKIEKEKRYQELLKKEAEDKKMKLREYKEKQLEENKIKEQQNVEQQKQKQEQDKKQRDEFQKKQKEEVKKVLEQKKNNFKEKEQQEKQKEIKQKEEMQEWKNNVEIMLKEEQEQRLREKQIQSKINELFNDTEVQNIFKSKEKQLQAVYHSYQEYTDWKIENTDAEKDLLQFKGFTNFASQFSIYPAIISPEDAQLIFRSLSRERERQQQILNEKNGFTAPLTKGMSYKEFEQALLRISIKGQKYFDLLADKYQKDMNQVEMIALKKENKNNAQIDEPLDKREDQYNLVDSSSAKTLLGLIYFMDMPEDKSELQSKLKALKLEYQKVAAQRDKKQTLQQKLGEDFPIPQPIKRNASQKKEIKKDDSKKSVTRKDEKTPIVNRQKSVNNRIPSAQSQIQSVNKSDLQKQSPKKMQAIGPNGEKEQWELNQDK